MIWMSMAVALAADLSGSWALDPDASESLEPFLEAQGVGRLQRRLAASTAPVATITQAHDTVTITLTDRLGERTDVLRVDGIVRDTETRDGTVPCRSSWVGEDLQTRCTLSSGELTVTRRRAEDTLTQVLQLATPHETISVRRVFRRR